MIRSSDILATVHAANRLTPKGGVIMPSARLTTMMMPKCTGSIPKCMATGTKMGASTMMAAEVSMNMPMTNKAAFTPKRNQPGDCKMSLSHRPIASGMPARVIRKANSPALAMMNMITALEMTDLRSTANKSAQRNSRWMNRPMIRA